MSDYAFILCFFSMLLLPCVVAFRNARSSKEVSGPESAETGTYLKATNSPELTRAELVAKRNRELYLRSMGKLGA